MNEILYFYILPYYLPSPFLCIHYVHNYRPIIRKPTSNILINVKRHTNCKQYYFTVPFSLSSYTLPNLTKTRLTLGLSTERSSLTDSLVRRTVPHWKELPSSFYYYFYLHTENIRPNGPFLVFVRFGRHPHNTW